MKDFRQSKKFRPYQRVGLLPVLGEQGTVEAKLINYSHRFGCMSQSFKARLFNTAQETLEPGNTDAAHRLSAIANYLTTISRELLVDSRKPRPEGP